MDAPTGTTPAARFQEMQHPIHQHPVPEIWQVKFEKGASAQPGHLALANGATRLDLSGPQGISASQSLRVEQASATFSLLPLTSSGRQLDLTAALELSLETDHLSIGGVRSSQHRPRQHADQESTVFNGYRARW